MVTTAAVVNASSLQLTFLLFLAVVVVTLFSVLLTAPHRDEISEFYLGNRTMTPLRNGLAMCGDYLSAATLLGSTGLVALTGYDGLLYLGGTAVAWMMVLLLIAEPLRNAGKFTLGDTIALRMPTRQRPVRLALSLCTLAVTTLYLVAQLVGSVALLTQFTGEPSAATRTLCVVVIGTIVIVYAALGGMPGATFIQIVKAVMLISGVTVTAVMVLHHFHWNIEALLTAAADNSGMGTRFLEPGLRYGGSTTSKLDFFSLQLAIVLGLAALPHIMMRLLAPRSSSVLRTSVVWAMGLVGLVCLAAGILGLGATAVVGRETIARTDHKGDAAVLLLAHALGGGLLTALLSCLAFVTLLAVAAGVTLAAASSSPTTSTARSSARARPSRPRNSSSPGSPRPSSASSACCSPSCPGAPTPPPWPSSPSPSPPPPSCPPSSTPCSGGASPRPGPSSASAAACCAPYSSSCSHPSSPPPRTRFTRMPTSPGSRSRIPASSRSRPASSSAGSARS